MAVEIKNELRAAAIVAGADGGAALQLFGFTFKRTGMGVYEFTLDSAVDPTQLSIYCAPGINELALPRGRFVSSTVLEVRSYTPAAVPVDCVVLFVEVHRYPGRLGAVFPATPPIPTPGGDGGGLVWNSEIVNGAFQGVSGILYPWDAAVGPSVMTFPAGPGDNDLIGVKNVSTSELNAFGFLPDGNDVEDPDTGPASVAGFYLAASLDGGFGGALALVIWRFSSLTSKWHIMHAAKRGSAEVLAPP